MFPALQRLQENMFKPCREIPQCATPEFTYNGGVVTREVFVASTRTTRAYKPTDEIQCGSFAYYDEGTGKCALDREVLPLYVGMCESEQATKAKVAAACNKMSMGGYDVYPASQLASHCQNIAASGEGAPSSDMEANDARIYAVVSSINRITDMFQVPGGAGISSGAVFVQMTDCAEAVYQAVQGSRSKEVSYTSSAPYQAGLYYVMRHTLVEMPLGFWHKCLVLQGRTTKYWLEVRRIG